MDPMPDAFRDFKHGLKGYIKYATEFHADCVFDICSAVSRASSTR